MEPLTDEQRLEVIREIWEFGYLTDREPFRAMNEYERLARERVLNRSRACDTEPAPPP